MTLPARPAKPVQIIEFNHRLQTAPASPAFTGKPVEGGEKYARRRLMRRLVQDGERTYHAYSADELIEIDSLAHHGRPGMPY